MINFEPLQLSQRDEYNNLLFRGQERGCEYSFANLYLWGRQRCAILGDHFVLFSQFNRRTVYPFPVGAGDAKPVLDAIIADAQERDIPCRITGLSEAECRLIEELYPGQFRIHCDRDSYDYVYDNAGNASVYEKEINVIDTTAPELEVDYIEIDIENIDSLEEQIKFKDNAQGDITVEEIDNNLSPEEGDYQITYKVTDASGNSSFQTLNVKITNLYKTS